MCARPEFISRIASNCVASSFGAGTPPVYSLMRLPAAHALLCAGGIWNFIVFPRYVNECWGGGSSSDVSWQRYGIDRQHLPVVLVLVQYAEDPRLGARNVSKAAECLRDHAAPVDVADEFGFATYEPIAHVVHALQFTSGQMDAASARNTMIDLFRSKE